MVPSFLLLKSLCSVGKLKKNLSLQKGTSGLTTAHQVGCENQVVLKD
jgi:hypothetical protein